MGIGTTGLTPERDANALEGESRVPWRASIVTLFPGIFSGWIEQGVVSRAMERGVAEVSLIDLRAFGVGRHAVTDDYPFGGGVGMVMKPEPLFAAVESLEIGAGTPIILLSPRGRRFDQAVAAELSRGSGVVLISGHYEGVDERVREHLATDEISIGDYVLSCGELAAMVVTDAAVRLLPGALREGAADEESFSHGLLEYPQYTRPAVFHQWHVPPVLLSGHHGEVDRWRREQALLVTARRRPDLLGGLDLTDADRDMLRAAGVRIDADRQLE
jgi:tRNA (guanine37-N1)-methyltransferase